MLFAETFFSGRKEDKGMPGNGGKHAFDTTLRSPMFRCIDISDTISNTDSFTTGTDFGPTPARNRRPVTLHTPSEHDPNEQRAGTDQNVPVAVCDFYVYSNKYTNSMRQLWQAVT